ncbi:hypothetical protein D1B31_21555 [Neobacillus notoginsengisoli]|uniref:Uncharacterized protein n=1 Tax=Neobacillus notoginsengisoli TaxID=1578198 RepID=A0A417YH01_9BACI|nr:hypothetical protein [Neobacillus notoginsengisoli]RHW32129.1 hypothetical protein D1B31_21555 [Neobacillus notoginsengisoli]
MRLLCKACKTVISNELKFLEDDSKLNQDIVGEDFIPQGLFIINSDDVYPARIRNRIIINIKDLIHCKYHRDRRRLNGCCGKDGCDGNNLVCQNNHEIGVEISDCWQPHLVALDPNLVEQSFVQSN